ncbi:hypothetical protein HU200_011633 [Digitaria exilis]|uniref:Uncharacterized protein n=1 Tax=Digitaria exilis TaxID=1010633 RepID=A0A835AYV9_9POAL|nr:hypothetical protein HU200_052457 [Digitaria exilis]KAF8753575.1 hypothetical protein HU200_011633 [Digitaria exilis]
MVKCSSIIVLATVF